MESINLLIQLSKRTREQSGLDLINLESAGQAEPKIQKIDDLHQFKDENQTLRNENYALNTENQLLKGQLKVASDCETLADHRQMPAKEVGLTSPCLDEQRLDKCQLFAPSLPAEILTLIFKNITDTSSLLACRAVCTSWKPVIDNTPAFMRRFTFLVMHPHFFRDLTNIAPRVRSIKFKHILSSTEKDLQDLFRAIGPTLESVAFEFDKHENSSIIRRQQRRMVSKVLRQCPKLNELRLLSKHTDFIHFLHTEPRLFNNITSLTMLVSDDSNDHVALQELIIGMPRLSILTLFLQSKSVQNYEVDKAIANAVCRHLFMYPGVLKKLGYTTDGHRGFKELHQSWTELFLLASKHDVVVTTDRPFNLIHLCRFRPTHEYPINLTTCSAIRNALFYHYVFNNANLDRVHHARNVEQLELRNRWGDDNIGSDISQQTRDILGRLHKLRKLTLSGFAVLSESVTTLFSSLHVHFPNLTYLRLYRSCAPETIFVQLARLNKLATLELEYLTRLTDAVFLHPQTNKNFPAIANLPKLKELTLWDCGDLTDNCLVNGILLSPTLETLTLLDCKGFTEVGYTAITDGRLKKRRIAQQGIAVGLTFNLP